MNAARGTLFGLGMGPGDPKLVTLKAAEILRQVPVVFAAGSSKNEYSLALDIATPHMTSDTEVVKLPFPMTFDKDALDQAWADNARQVLAVLDSGRDAAFVTIGDPLTYSTYGYLIRTLLKIDPEACIETVPGVTAYNTAAARVNLPLVEGKETLMVVPGVTSMEKIKQLTELVENLVILKAYRNYDEICDTLGEWDHLGEMVMVSKCGLPDERVSLDARSLKGQEHPYLTLLIAKKNGKEA